MTSVVSFIVTAALAVIATAGHYGSGQYGWAIVTAALFGVAVGALSIIWINHSTGDR